MKKKVEDYEILKLFGLEDSMFASLKHYETAIQNLSSLYESAPTVYGCNARLWKTNRQDSRIENNGMVIEPDTHTAKLMFIEEIKNTECVHEPVPRFDGPCTQDWVIVCKHCGKIVTTVWSAE